jgi:hypothetical protein
LQQEFLCFYSFLLFKCGQGCSKANTENAGETLHPALRWLKAVGLAAWLVWQSGCNNRLWRNLFPDSGSAVFDA